jgi:putative transposase
MPGRLPPLVTNETYHIFNRGIDHRPTFTDKREYHRALQGLAFYQFSSPPVKLSLFLSLPEERKEKIMDQLIHQGKKSIRILAFCFMPNHFHFLVFQETENGISKFMSNFQNSFTRYFNTKHERIGPLFLDQFKAVRIETDDQLLHVSRYIHLNPYSSAVIKNLKVLENYPWSSLNEYINLLQKEICEKETILSFFRNKKAYQEFVFDQADYQKELEKIKHLALEDQTPLPPPRWKRVYFPQGKISL